MPDWMPVYGSSIVQAIRYDEGKREVEVRFSAGDVYAYEDVPPEVWNELVNAGSKGRYVNIVLKRGYSYRRVVSTKPPPQIQEE